jgi:DNA-binding response OmpR family regulator
MRNILIVDAHPQDFDELSSELVGTDTACHFACSAEAALRVAQTLHPVLWLINIALPDMSGHELLAELKTRRCKEALWLIADAYSAIDEIRARTAGAAVFTCKPIRGLAHLGPIGSQNWHRPALDLVNC